MNKIEKSLKDKIKEIREIGLNVSNDEIILVLEYYEGIVTDAKNAFLTDGAKEALQQWKLSGQKTSAPKTKKKKKKTNRPPEIENNLEHSRIQLTSIEPTSLPLTEMANSNTDQITCHNMPDSILQDKHSSSTFATIADVAVEARKNKEKVRHIEDYKIKSKKERERTMSEVSHITDKSLPSKPMSGIEKSAKDLDKLMSSFPHLQTQLNDGFTKSYKRLQQVFLELRTLLNKKEEELKLELDDEKVQTVSALLNYETSVIQLKQQTMRSSSMSEQQLTRLRTQIKAYVSEKKNYEELISSPQLQIDFNQITKNIQNFAQVPKLKKISHIDDNNMVENLIETRLMDSAPTVDPKISSSQILPQTTMTLTTSTITASLSQPNVLTSSHIINQSESLTRYEQEAGVTKLANIVTNYKSSFSSNRGRGGRNGGRGQGRKDSGDRQLSSDNNNRNKSATVRQKIGDLTTKENTTSEKIQQDGKNLLSSHKSGELNGQERDNSGKGDTVGRQRNNSGKSGSGNRQGGRGGGRGRGRESNSGGRIYDQRYNVHNEHMSKNSMDIQAPFTTNKIIVSSQVTDDARNLKDSASKLSDKKNDSNKNEKKQNRDNAGNLSNKSNSFKNDEKHSSSSEQCREDEKSHSLVNKTDNVRSSTEMSTITLSSSLFPDTNYNSDNYSNTINYNPSVTQVDSKCSVTETIKENLIRVDKNVDEAKSSNGMVESVSNGGVEKINNKAAEIEEEIRPPILNGINGIDGDVMPQRQPRTKIFP